MKIEHDKSINQRIRACRQIKRYNQERMAKLLGIKVSSYSQMEREGRINCDYLKRIAEILDVDAYFLLYGREHPNVIIEKAVKPKEEDENIKLKLSKRYEFLNTATKKDLTCIKTIYSLRKKQRMQVYKYALDIFQKRIKI